LIVNAQDNENLKSIEELRKKYEILWKYLEMQVAMRVSLIEAIEKIMGVTESKGLIRLALRRYLERVFKKNPALLKIRTLEEILTVNIKLGQYLLGIRSELKIHSPQHYTVIRYDCPHLAYVKDQPLFCIPCALEPEVAAELLLKTDAKTELKKTLARGDPYCEFTITLK
jgi:predicted ArsR family transcriptional regulator